MKQPRRTPSLVPARTEPSTPAAPKRRPIAVEADRLATVAGGFFSNQTGE